MNSELSGQISDLEHRYAEALTAGKDVRVLSRIWEKIKQLRLKVEQSSGISKDRNSNNSNNSLKG